MQPPCAAVPGGDCVLAGQVSHTPAAEYLPATQSTQLARLPEPTGEDFPATQPVHASGVNAPWMELAVPAAQSAHTEAPVLTTYFPATHNVHTSEPTLAAKFPA